MANKQWPRWVAAVAALAMAGSLPGTALAAPAQGDAASTTPTLSTGNLKSKVSSQLQQAKGEVTAFIQTTSPPRWNVRTVCSRTSAGSVPRCPR